MRVLIITRFYKNGQTTHVADLCAELIRQGHQVMLVITQLHDPIYVQWLNARRILYLTTSDPRKLYKHLVEWQPDIIHNHSAHTLAATIDLGQHLQVRTLTTVHYLDFEPRELLQEQSAVVLISEEMKAFFSNLSVPTFVVENGVNIPLPNHFRKPWQKRALILAQVTAEKEENFRRISRDLLDWGWKVTSAGNWRFKGVKHLGWVNDVWPLLKQADLVVGTGRAIREGMAANSAVWILGTYSDGLVTPENVELLRQTNFSGRTSKREYCSQSASGDLKDPSIERLQALGNFGRQYASEHFSSKKMAEKLALIYKGILES
ncbi:MAG: glycosyltransferase family 4 protein [Firmicutes bacterium]|nr:glycosyltransferase family 4 protein [Bacillota bacterium]